MFCTPAPGPGCAAIALVLLSYAAAGCDRGKASSQEQAAPTASVIALGLVIGTCDDIAICENECDAGSADRCRRLAATYGLGRGVEKDETRATALYEQACAMKDPAACVFAGQMHEYAHGVPKDDTKAAHLYDRACEMQWAAGCYNLAIMQENGRGVPQNREEARRLYQIACTAGAKLACERARQLHVARQAPFFDGAVP
jgi:TPR repeat protein